MKNKQLGFSLIELMIGMLLALIATFVITNVFYKYEGQKRTTIASSDAQVNGNIGLFAIQRDALSAGYGLPVFNSEVNPLSCPLDKTVSVDHDNVSATANVDINNAPILLEDGGAASDKLFIRYGDAMQGGGSVFITDASNPANGIGLESDIGCAVEDVVLVVQGVGASTDCQFSRVLSKPAVNKVTLSNTNLATNGNALACLGAWNEFQYQIVGNTLQRNGQVLVSDIVSMQAQYGISATGNNVEVTEWVNPTGNTWGKAALTTNSATNLANRNRIKAIRVAIVARNGILEKTNVTTACSSLTVANPTGLCAWDATSAGPTVSSPAPAIDLSADPNWRKYRYKVYETVIPLKNVIWSSSVL